jgi:hypothetical protein
MLGIIATLLAEIIGITTLALITKAVLIKTSLGVTE